jgi:hypothetical protein
MWACAYYLLCLLLSLYCLVLRSWNIKIRVVNLTRRMVFIIDDASFQQIDTEFIIGMSGGRISLVITLARRGIPFLCSTRLSASELTDKCLDGLGKRLGTVGSSVLRATAQISSLAYLANRRHSWCLALALFLISSLSPRGVVRMGILVAILLSTEYEFCAWMRFHLACLC